MLGDLAKNVALGAAERVRKNLGPRAGLVSYRALAENAADAETRGRAVLEGISCAIEVADRDAIAALVGLYAGVDDAASLETQARATVLVLERNGHSLSARGLASLELERFPRARSAYLLGRCLERARDRGALAAFERAESLAKTEGASDVEAASRAFRVALLYEATRLEEARALEKNLVLRGLPPLLLLRIARHGLASPSRFTRASWLSELDRVAQDVASSRVVATTALGLVCAHADRMGYGLTELERDRVLAVFSKMRDEAHGARLKACLLSWAELRNTVHEMGPRKADDVLGVLERAGADAEALAFARRALDVAQGRFEPKGELPQGDAARLAVVAAAALRDADVLRAEAALTLLAKEIVTARAPKQRPAWEVAYVGLFSEHEGVRRASLAVVGALVHSAPSPCPPERGALVVARACRAAGDEPLSERLLAMAVSAREPGAAEAYFEAARELGWKEALLGRRSEALRLLREAKRSGG